jgi:hypothetical protein
MRPEMISQCRTSKYKKLLECKIPTSRDKKKYRLKYRAQQFNRRLGINTIQEQENEEDESFENFGDRTMQTDEEEEVNQTHENNTSTV